MCLLKWPGNMICWVNAKATKSDGVGLSPGVPIPLDWHVHSVTQILQSRLNVASETPQFFQKERDRNHLTGDQPLFYFAKPLCPIHMLLISSC